MLELITLPVILLIGAVLIVAGFAALSSLTSPECNQVTNKIFKMQRYSFVAFLLVFAVVVIAH